MAITIDVWAETLYAATYAGIPLDVMLTEDEVQRSLARLEYPRKDGADIQPMGNGPRRTRVRIEFFEREPDEDDDAQGFGDDNHLDRLSTFVQTALSATQPHPFVHPLFGAYDAWVENLTFSANADERNQVMVECDFVEDSTSPSVILSPENAPHQSATADVNALCDTLDAQLADVDLPAESTAADIPNDARTAVAGWDDDPGTTIRDVNGDISRLTDAIDDAVNDIDYATDLDNYQVFRTLARLHGSIRRAGELFRRVSPQLAEYAVTHARPLRAIAVDLYGAADWERGYAELAKLNDVPDPGLVTPGVTLQYVVQNPVGIAAPRGLRGRVAR